MTSIARGNTPVKFCLLGNEPLVAPDRFGERILTIRGVTAKATTDPDEAAAWLDVPRETVS